MARVSNDALVVPLTTLGFWLLARVWVAKGRQAGLLGLTGVVSGLAALAKLSGLILVPVGVLALLGRAVRDRRRLDGFAADLALFMGPALLISGWWFGLNLGLYGDPTGLNVMVDVAGPRRGSPDLLAEARGTVWSYWAVFGWMNVGPEPAVLRGVEGLTILGLLGAAGLTARSLLRRPPGR